MKCPYCTSSDTRVINSRPSDEGASIRRRRDCENCHRRFTTYERAQFEALMVSKRSGRREPFNPDKLLDKLRIACNKRPVTEKQLREFAYGFEDEVQVPEIASEEIGMRTLRFLKELDDVAYIRFLSVYRDFDSVDRFIDEIRQLGEVAEGSPQVAGDDEDLPAEPEAKGGGNGSNAGSGDDEAPDASSGKDGAPDASSGKDGARNAGSDEKAAPTGNGKRARSTAQQPSLLEGLDPEKRGEG